MMSIKELVDELRREEAARSMIIRRISDQIEAMDPASNPFDPHWLNFPLELRPVRVTGEFGVMYTVGVATWQHEGIDFSAPVGSGVHACALGTVILAESRTGYGQVIRLEHNQAGEKWYTWYAHLSHFLCAVGDVVRPNQLIAFSGNTGNTTGPHLHLTVQRESSDFQPKGCAPILRGCVNPRDFVVWPA